MSELTETQKKILAVGKKEFLAKGFKEASLRDIVKEAGFTQGAFYGYYPDRAALFEAPVCSLVDDPVEIEVSHELHRMITSVNFTAVLKL